MNTIKNTGSTGRVYKIWGFLFILLFIISGFAAIASITSWVIPVIFFIGSIMIFALGDLLLVLNKIERKLGEKE